MSPVRASKKNKVVFLPEVLLFLGSFSDSMVTWDGRVIDSRTALLILFASIAILDVVMPKAHWASDSTDQNQQSISESRNELPRSQALGQEKRAIMPSPSEEISTGPHVSSQHAVVSEQPILELKTATGQQQGKLKLHAESLRRRAEEKDERKVRLLAEAEAAAATLPSSGAAGSPPSAQKLSPGPLYVSPAAQGAQGAKAFHDLVLKHSGDHHAC